MNIHEFKKRFDEYYKLICGTAHSDEIKEVDFWFDDKVLVAKEMEMDFNFGCGCEIGVLLHLREDREDWEIETEKNEIKEKFGAPRGYLSQIPDLIFELEVSDRHSVKYSELQSKICDHAINALKHLDQLENEVIDKI